MAVAITPEMCVTGRELTEPKLDPSGARVAFVGRGPAGTAISIIEFRDDGETWPERLLTTLPTPAPGRGMGGGCFDWLPGGVGIIYSAADGALWRLPVPGGPAVRVTEADDERPAQAPAVAPDGSFVAYVVDQAEVWVQPLDGGPGRRVDGAEHDFCFDPIVDPTSSRIAYQAWSVPDMPWDGAAIMTVAVADGSRVTWRPPDAAAQQPRFAPDGTPLVVHDGSGWLNVWWGDRPLVAGGDTVEHAEPSWGPGQASFAISPDGARVAFTRNERGFGRLCVADVSDGSVVEIAKGVHGQLSWRGGRLAALRTGARTPTQVVVYDTQSWERRLVAVGPVAGWDGADLAEPDLVTIEHDGCTLHGRVYRAGPTSGRLMCWLHGGPTGQWNVTFMPRLAYWLDRGWDILVPDYRGSTGHGRQYQQALRGRWGELDVGDTVAWLDHVHTQGWSKPERTVLVGGSAGGLTALGVLGLHPGRAAGGVVLYPVTDLAELAARSHRFEAHYTDTLVGPLSNGDLYARRSPVNYAERISVPVLVMHGTDDRAVPVESTIAFVERMREAGGDVNLHLFDGEGHGFRQTENQLAEFRLMDGFLRRIVE